MTELKKQMSPLRSIEDVLSILKLHSSFREMHIHPRNLYSVDKGQCIIYATARSRVRTLTKKEEERNAYPLCI